MRSISFLALPVALSSLLAPMGKGKDDRSCIDERNCRREEVCTKKSKWDLVGVCKKDVKGKKR